MVEILTQKEGRKFGETTKLLEWLKNLDPKNLVKSLYEKKYAESIRKLIKVPVEHSVKELKDKQFKNLDSDEKTLLVLSAWLYDQNLSLPKITGTDFDQTYYDTIASDEFRRLFPPVWTKTFWQKLQNFISTLELTSHSSSNISFKSYWLKDFLDFFDPNIKKDIDTKITQIANSYWVDVVFGADEIQSILGNKYWINLLSPTQLIPQLDMLIQELSIYPAWFIQKSWLKGIVLTQGQQRRKKELYKWNHLSAWFPTSSGFLVIGSFDEKNKEKFLIHHELYHLLDKKKNSHDNKSWENLWKSHFSIDKTTDLSLKNSMPPEESLKRFLIFAAASPNEDQAVTAHFLMKYPTTILQAAKTNDILKRKIEVITWCEINKDFTWFAKDYTRAKFVYTYGRYWFENGKAYYAKRSDGAMDYKWRNQRIGLNTSPTSVS